MTLVCVGAAFVAQVVCHAILHSLLGDLFECPRRVEKIRAEKRWRRRYYKLSSCLVLVGQLSQDYHLPALTKRTRHWQFLTGSL